MYKSIFKVFFSKDKEVKWLNKLGQEGYLLNSVSDSKYYFVINEEEKYYYSIENLDCSPRSEKAVQYFKSREELGISPLIASGNFVYFVSKNKEIEATDEILKNNSKIYFWRSLYLLFFAICGSVFCGYHIYASGFLTAIGQAGEGKIELLSTDGGVAILNVTKTGLNYIIKALNKYIGLWIDEFGKNDAVATVSIIVPIVLVLLIIATFNVDSYITYFNARRRLKKHKSENEASKPLVLNNILEDTNNAE